MTKFTHNKETKGSRYQGVYKNKRKTLQEEIKFQEGFHWYSKNIINGITKIHFCTSETQAHKCYQEIKPNNSLQKNLKKIKYNYGNNDKDYNEENMNSSKLKERKLTPKQKIKIASRQYYKCANSPNSQVISNYVCPLWKRKIHQGSFDESGYDVDHIEEFCISGNDKEYNLQALCLSCHRVKTKRFNSRKKVD